MDDLVLVLLGTHQKHTWYGSYAHVNKFCTFSVQLAEGLEKSRNDNSLIVWDVNRAAAATESQPSTSITASRL